MKEDDYVRVFGLVAFFLVALVVLIVAMVSSRRRRREEVKAEEERDRHIQEGINQGVLAKNPVTGEVYPRCLICGGKAAARPPISGVSWMDRLPLLNRLFSLPPRYTIVDDEEGELQYCKIHKDLAVKKLEQFHAALRAERSRFNAGQADKVAQMDAGGLYQVLLEQHKGAMEMFEQRKEELGELPLLPPATPSTKQVLSRMTTSSGRGDDDDDERPHLEVVNGS